MGLTLSKISGARGYFNMTKAYLYVTSGLVLNLDAGNSSSYPGTGTAWTDLSTTNNNFNLINGPTFNSGNGGSIVFDGSNDYAGGSLSSAVTNNFTVDVWCRPAATIAVYNQTTAGFNPPFLSGHRFVVAPDQYGLTSWGAGISVGTNGINIIEHGAGHFPSPLVHYTTISNTVFTNITLLYINKQPSLYINGTFVKTGLTTSSQVTYLSTTTIGTLYGFYQGNISVVRSYNRSLSASEILQNFNATRGRYGI